MRGKYEICGVEVIVPDKDKDLKDYINSGNTCKVIHCLSPKELDGAEYYLSYLRQTHGSPFGIGAAGL